MLVFVTPLSVAPVACPFPQGDGSVPNLVIEMDDAAPATDVDVTTPAAVSVMSSNPTAPARMPVILFMPTPRSAPQNLVLPPQQ